MEICLKRTDLVSGSAAFFGIEVVALAHQLDFAGHVQAGYQQDNFPLRFPAPGDAREAINDIGQQHPLDAGLEVQVFAQLLDGEGVALLPIQIESPADQYRQPPGRL